MKLKRQRRQQQQQQHQQQQHQQQQQQQQLVDRHRQSNSINGSTNGQQSLKFTKLLEIWTSQKMPYITKVQYLILVLIHLGNLHKKRKNSFFFIGLSPVVVTTKKKIGKDLTNWRKTKNSNTALSSFFFFFFFFLKISNCIKSSSSLLASLSRKTTFHCISASFLSFLLFFRIH